MKSRQEIHNSRPISPHLTIYKKQISSVLSIFHRLTGAGLFFGFAIVMWWFSLLIFSRFDSFYIELGGGCLVRGCLVLISFSGFYHFCTGIRHLVWDTGRWFSIKAVNVSGWIAVICSIIFTAVFWVYIYQL